MGEANVPAEQPQAGEEPRVPPSHGDARRSGHPEGPATQGSSPALGLGPPVNRVWRIKDRQTFLALRASRRRVRKGPITVTFAPAVKPAPPQVAYAIGRRVGGAVVRNRLRRRMRAIVADTAGELAPGAYLVGVAPEATTLSFGELKTIVLQALQAVGEGRR